MDIGFALNYQHILEVDITPGGEKRTWAWVGPGISTIGSDGSETTSEDSYYNNGGNTKVDVTGVSKKYSVEGHRRIGDAFQDFVASIEDAVGADRETRYRITDPTGRVIEAACTITDISASGPNGAANEKTAFKCSICRDGVPVAVTEAAGAALPDSVDVSAPVTVQQGKTVEVKPTVTPSDASPRCVFAIEDPKVATVSADGVVTGVKSGKTRLAVKCAAKPSVSKVVEVTVSA